MIRKARPFILVVAILAALAGAWYALHNPSFKISQPQLSFGLRTLFTAITFALYCCVLVFSIISGRSKFAFSAVKAAKILIWMLLLAIVGALVSRYVTTAYPSEIMYASIGVVAIAFIWRYVARRKRSSDAVSSTAIRRSAAGSGASKYSFAMLHGALLVAMLATVTYFFLTMKKSDNYFILAPLAATLVSIILWRIVRWRGMLLVAILAVLSAAIIFVYGSVVSYGFSAFAPVVAFSLLYLAMLVPMCDLYCRKEQNI